MIDGVPMHASQSLGREDRIPFNQMMLDGETSCGGLRAYETSPFPGWCGSGQMLALLEESLSDAYPPEYAPLGC